MRKKQNLGTSKKDKTPKAKRVDIKKFPWYTETSRPPLSETERSDYGPQRLDMGSFSEETV